MGSDSSANALRPGASADAASRRRYRRLTVRLDVSWRVEADGHIGAATATTLGAGGLFVGSETPLPPGTALRVRFRLPGGEAAHELAGKVVWANDASTRGVPASGRGMGIAFRDPSAQALLAKDLARLEPQLSQAGSGPVE